MRTVTSVEHEVTVLLTHASVDEGLTYILETEQVDQLVPVIVAWVGGNESGDDR